MTDWFKDISDSLNLANINPREAAPLSLAFVGDAVYEVIIRTMEASHGNRQSYKLHKDSVRYVNAGCQARMIEMLAPLLTEEEAGYYRRGKNSKPATTAKNASKAEYLKATGFEALVGYLFLSGQTERLLELVKQGIELVNGEDNTNG